MVQDTVRETVNKTVKSIAAQPALSIENLEKAINIDNFDEEIKENNNKKRHRSDDKKL